MDQSVQNTDFSLDKMEAIEYNLEDELQGLNDWLDQRTRDRFKRKYNTQKPVRWAIVRSHRILAHGNIQDILEAAYDEQSRTMSPMRKKTNLRGDNERLRGSGDTVRVRLFVKEESSKADS